MKKVLYVTVIYTTGVLLPNYPEESIVKGENVPNFKVNISEGTSSNVFWILQDLQLQDLWLKQYQNQCHSNTMLSTLKMFQTTNKMEQMAQPVASFRTTTPSTAMTDTTTTTKQVNPVHVHQELKGKSYK